MYIARGIVAVATINYSLAMSTLWQIEKKLDLVIALGFNPLEFDILSIRQLLKYPGIFIECGLIKSDDETMMVARCAFGQVYAIANTLRIKIYNVQWWTAIWHFA